MAKKTKEPLPLLGSSNSQMENIEPSDFDPEYSTFEQLGATAILGMYDNMTPSIFRAAQGLSQAADESDPFVGVNELKQRYPDLQDTFDKPLRGKQAETIAERERFRKVLRDVSENGPDTKTNAALKIGVGLLSGFVDPLSIAAGAGITKAIGAAGKAIPQISKAIGTEAAATIAGRMRIAGAEGFIGAAVEQPFALAASEIDYGDYDIYDAAVNMAIAPILGAGISGVASAIGRTFKLDSSIKSETAMLIQAQQNSGLVMNTKHLDSFGSSKTSNPDFVYKKFEAAQEFRDKKFYIPSTKAGEEMKADSMAKILDDLGEGVYMTDDLVVANRFTHNGEVTANGGLFEAKFRDEPTVLDLDSKPIDDDLAALVEAGVKSPETKTIKQSLQELMDINPEKVELLKDKFSERYDVAMHSGGEYRGAAHSRANTMIVLRPEKLETSYYGGTDASSLKSFDSVDRETANSLMNGEPAGYTKEDALAFDRRANSPMQERKLVEMDKDLELLNEQLDAAMELGYLTEKDIADLKADPMLKHMDNDKQVFKLLADCLE